MKILGQWFGWPLAAEAEVGRLDRPRLHLDLLPDLLLLLPLDPRLEQLLRHPRRLAMVRVQAALGTLILVAKDIFVLMETEKLSHASHRIASFVEIPSENTTLGHYM